MVATLLKPVRLSVLFLVFVVLAGCQTTQGNASHIHTAAPGGVTFEGGDGSSFESAIAIRGATEFTGIVAENYLLNERYPGYRLGSQSLVHRKSRVYDVIEFTSADGKKKVTYFDITDFFGKY
jgi:hypothetical protein